MSSIGDCQNELKKESKAFTKKKNECDMVIKYYRFLNSKVMNVDYCLNPATGISI